MFSQNFTLTRDDYGITRIEDLSAKDMEKVRSLALIELTALFDQNNLVFNRRKPTKRKTKGNFPMYESNEDVYFMALQNPDFDWLIRKNVHPDHSRSF